MRHRGNAARTSGMRPGTWLAGAIALGSPWYLRTWVRTGSPVFPFFAHILPGNAPGWDQERSAMLVGFNAHYLLQVLSSIEQDDVVLGVSGELDPATVRPGAPSARGDYLAVIMPMRI